MNIAIICSKGDTASMTIRQALLELYPFKETQDLFEANPVYELNTDVRLYTTETRSIYCERIDAKIGADLFIFATRHEAKSGIPSLSVHTQGNWAKAELGGVDRQLGISPACYLKEGLKKLDELGAGLKADGFDIIQECTHHGPYMEKPSLFIEIGSSEKQWGDIEPAKVIAQVIHHLIAGEPPNCRAAVGIGGPHHTPNFKKVVLSSDIAIGHVCPKYMLAHLDKELLMQAIDKTVPKAELIILDWKGLDSKEKILEMLKAVKRSTAIEIKKTKDF
jgi:D-aminoacyl-tRNA deacylase